MKEFFTGNALYGVFSRMVHTQSNALTYVIFFGFLALCIIGAYLIGSFNAAIFLSRHIYHDDIRNHGSGNAGTTNMLRTFGPKAAVATLALDAFKTALAVLYAWTMMGGNWAPFGFSLSVAGYLAMLFCILGHIYPIYYKMRGGKGILCASVCIGMLSPWVLLILAVIFVGTVAFTKYVSLGSILCAACYPLFLNSLVKALFGGLSLPGELLMISLLVMGLLIFAHRSNIKRLYRHEEHRISFRRRTENLPPAGGNSADNGGEDSHDA